MEHKEKQVLERDLRAKIDSLRSDIALRIWVRDVLCGALGMENDLIWAREQAQRLHSEANEIEHRAAQRLVDDVIAEWSSEAIYKACRK